MKTTGIIPKICNLKMYSLLIMLFASISCKSQSPKCGYPNVYDPIAKNRVYTLVDTMPIFLGNEGDIGKYIANIYQDSTKVGMQLSIKLGFIIDKSGKLIAPRIVNKKESEYLEEECQIIEIIKSSPRWKPGICSNKEVNVLLQTRLRFVIVEKGKLR